MNKTCSQRENKRVFFFFYSLFPHASWNVDLVVDSQKGFVEPQVEMLYLKMSNKSTMLKLEINGVWGSPASQKAELGIGW